MSMFLFVFFNHVRVLIFSATPLLIGFAVVIVRASVFE